MKAYADDVTAFLTKEEVLKNLLHTIMIYGTVSEIISVSKNTASFQGDGRTEQSWVFSGLIKVEIALESVTGTP